MKTTILLKINKTTLKNLYGKGERAACTITKDIINQPTFSIFWKCVNQ